MKGTKMEPHELMRQTGILLQDYAWGLILADAMEVEIKMVVREFDGQLSFMGELESV